LKKIRKTSILKGILVISLTTNLLTPVLINSVLAQDWQQAAKDLAQGSPIKEPSDIFRILAKVVQYAYTIFFIVAIIFIIVAAFNFLTAGGNPEKIQSARSQITWAVVAIAIALISVGAAQIIKTFITS
jgi:large-conductance mechanosensitive channel